MSEPIRPIRTETDHADALAQIDALFAAAPGSPEADRLEVLAVLVTEYERTRGSEAAHPIEVLTLAMKAQGRTQAELAELLGSRSRASEVLGRRRQLSAAMVEKLAQAWAIPAALLSVPYSVESRLMRALKTGAAVLAIMIGLSAAAIGGLFAWYGADLPNTEQIAATLAGSSASIPGFTPLGELPPELIKAFLAAEDEDFYAHGGYSRTAILRAAWKTLFTNKIQGGATITQQVAKNVLLKERPSIGRKIREIILANRLEKALTKDRILETWVNVIYFGGKEYGIRAASDRYFAKSPQDLSIAEAAYLAGLPKAPNVYRLDVADNRIRARERRDWVLHRMAADGMITVSAARLASSEPLTAPDR